MTMATVLVVDDAFVDRRLVGGLLAKSPNLRVTYASDGDEALRLMDELRPNLVVTDLVMPKMDGLELVALLVKSYPLVPVVLMTSRGGEMVAVEALRAGAASYVPKGELQNLLLRTVEDLLEISLEEQLRARLMDSMSGCRFVINNDATIIPALINHIRHFISKSNLCDEATCIRISVALEEALNNALYHGNLELDSRLRDGDRATYRAMIEERRNTDPYRKRKIHVAVEMEADYAKITISDEGPGFDLSQLPDPTEPANLEKLSGRGLLLMRTFMDEVEYNERGNQVTLIKRKNGSGTDSQR